MKLIKISEVVKKVLIKVPKTRDNDTLLILKVWAIQNPELRNTDGYTFRDFALGFLDGKYANPESVRRSRAKLQEELPELRGNNYQGRMLHQDDVKSELREIKNNLK